jgi:hypothetical protein
MAQRPKVEIATAGTHILSMRCIGGSTMKEIVMPFLIPVLVGIPVLFGGGYVIYHLVH